jgi:hypothetical protein
LGGIEILLESLFHKIEKVTESSLDLLFLLSQNQKVRYTIADLCGTEALMYYLSSPTNENLASLSCKVLDICCQEIEIKLYIDAMLKLENKAKIETTKGI